MPLGIPYLGVRVQAPNGVYADITNNIEQSRFSTLINGGFGTLTFFVPWLHSKGLPPWLQYLADVKAYDRFAFTCFEGRIDDISMTSQQGVEGFNVEAVGYGPAGAADPYVNVPVLRNLPWMQRSVLENPAVVRTDLYNLLIGNTNGNDLTRIGLAFGTKRSTIYPLQGFACARFVLPNLNVAGGYSLSRIKFDYSLTNTTNNTAVFGAGIYGITTAGAYTSVGTITVAGSGSSSIDLTGGIYVGVLIQLECTTGGTTGAATDTTLEVYNIRVLGPRVVPGGPVNFLADEPVYGHELVSDVINYSGCIWSGSRVLIDSDTSYAFPEAAWPDSVKMGDALDYVTAFYDRYWAVYEGRQMVWKSSANPPQITWSTSRAEGAKLDLDPSITNAAKTVRVRYQLQAGQNKETDIVDPRFDNIYTAAGQAHTNIVDLGVVANASAAAQIGAIYFPDHSYEVVKGTITLPAQLLVRGLNPGPAYRIRAGDNIQITDAVSPRQIAAGVYDRRTIFIVKATDVDWESQTVAVSVDNTRDSLSQLLARIGIAVPASNPAIR